MTGSDSVLTDFRLAMAEEVIDYSNAFEPTSGGLIVDENLFPISRGIIRCHTDDGYNQSFALQWNRFKTEQIDSLTGSRDTARRFSETGWDLENLANNWVLEAGCGPGRFTDLISSNRAKLVSFDYSTAVDANFENHVDRNNILFLQADIFDMPFKDEKFDYIFCHGVLQHTPNPEEAFRALLMKLAPGGKISIDVYRKDGLIRPWKSKYLWRWLTTRISPEKLLRFLEIFIPWWLPLDTFIKRIPYLGCYLGSIIPCWNYYDRDLTEDLKTRWAIMDTFDALAPSFDNPVTLADVECWMLDASLEKVEVRPGGNGIVANGIKGNSY